MAVPIGRSQAVGGIGDTGVGVGEAQIYGSGASEHTASVFKDIKESKAEASKAETKETQRRKDATKLPDTKPIATDFSHLYRDEVKEYMKWNQEHLHDADFDNQNQIKQERLRNIGVGLVEVSKKSGKISTTLISSPEGEFEGLEGFDDIMNNGAVLPDGMDAIDYITELSTKLDTVRKKPKKINYFDRVQQKLLPIVNQVAEQGSTFYTNPETGQVTNVDFKNFNINSAKKMIEDDLKDPTVFASAARTFNELEDDERLAYEENENPVIDWYKDTYAPYLVKEIRKTRSGGQSGGGPSSQEEAEATRDKDVKLLMDGDKEEIARIREGKWEGKQITNVRWAKGDIPGQGTQSYIRINFEDKDVEGGIGEVTINAKEKYKLSKVYNTLPGAKDVSRLGDIAPTNKEEAVNNKWSKYAE